MSGEPPVPRVLIPGGPCRSCPYGLPNLTLLVTAGPDSHDRRACRQVGFEPHQGEPPRLLADVSDVPLGGNPGGESAGGLTLEQNQVGRGHNPG